MQTNPALSAFVAALPAEFIFGQVWIARADRGFELRHAADKDGAAPALCLLTEKDVRPLAQFTERGAFRPLRSAPNLRRGWRASARDQEELGALLNQFYPGAVADWFAALTSPPPVTDYRPFTARQTGMYRITTHLDDATAGAAVRACCHQDFCLKRRLWTVPGQAPDAAPAKSVIPCLEPCALLLEFARKIARVVQDPGAHPSLTPAEAEAALIHPDPATAVAESDFDAPNNPRRLRFVLENRPGAVKPNIG